MRIKIDWFIVAICASAAISSFIPATGKAAEILHICTTAAITILFYLYGVRLEAKQAWQGLMHWRLHLTILAMTFVIFPILGIISFKILTGLIPAALALGMLYTSLVPSTVQSSIAFTSIAKGNIAGAIVSASASNLLGVVLTPLLVMFLFSQTGGVAIDPRAVIDISAQILLPFCLGQLTRKWTYGFVSTHPKLKLFDQGSIVLVVYAAFSKGVTEGIWQKIKGLDLLIILIVCLIILAIMLWFTHFAALKLGFNRGDQIAIQFCGTKKSLATGLPMAMILFPQQDSGMLMIPLMCFHMLQLLACSVLAARYAKEPRTVADSQENS